VTEHGIREYQCLVEHRYSDVALLYAHSETQERTLWAAVLVLEEAAVLARHVAAAIPAAAETLARQAEQKQEQARVLRTILTELKPFSVGD
jgi:hypothetical protein